MSTSEIENENFKRWERLSIIFDTLSHPYRLTLLEKIGARTIKDIADEIGVSPPALQRHVNKLLLAHLIEKKGNIYSLTTIGRTVLSQVNTFNQDIIVKLLEIEKNNARDIVFQSPLSVEDMEQILKQMKKKECKRGT